jgi:tellurite resistance protein TehA-like permease
MELPFFIAPPLCVIACLVLCIGGEMMRHDRIGAALLWLLTLMGQIIFVVWFPFMETHSLRSLLVADPPHMTLYDSVMLYGNWFYQIWFWLGVGVAALFVLLNATLPWLPIEIEK